MSHSAVLIYPHQLYKNHPALHKERLHVLVEDSLYFGDSRYPTDYHQMKLLFHRVTMKRYQQDVTGAGRYSSRYIDYAEIDDRLEYVFESLADDGIREIHVCDPTDDLLSKRITRYCERYNLSLTWYDSPNFVTTPAQIDEFWSDKDDHDYHQTDFYMWQRKRLDVLLTDDDKPVGGKWSYDPDNRQKLDKNMQLPSEPEARTSDLIAESREYIAQHFPDNPGSMEHFIYPTTHDAAQQWLNDFVRVKLNDFGKYQDAISTQGNFLFHSLLSPLLNAGLLRPMQIVEAALDYYHENPGTRLASVEGFIRQIIGWREFMRAVYLRDGTTQRNANFWGHQRGLSAAWYEGTLGIPPVDDAIQKAQQYAYNHHIERLMLVGNFMLLCEIHPQNVYRWFMEMFIDAYDWVMVPNVYGMSQYADGGLITTKPYISSSNYVRKMTRSYKRGDWCDIWDGLYWRFIHKHVDFFKGNPRLAVMTGHLSRMGEDKLQTHLDNASQFLESIE